MVHIPIKHVLRKWEGHCTASQKKTNKRERQDEKQVVWKIKKKHTDPDRKLRMHGRITTGI